MQDASSAILAYHERTKHHPNRYAPSPGYLDWASEPEPFRWYAGAPRVELPLAADGLSTSYADVLTPGAVPAAVPDVESVGTLLELSLGLSAWKESNGSRWALRCNPSSGNLHPTEGYVLVPLIPGLPAGLHHYVSRDHALERRAALEGAAADGLAASLPKGTFLAGLSSIHWREAWKYGERAYRYCQHDAGHALAAIRYSAAALGWSARLLELADATVASLLGLDREESFGGVDPLDRESPDMVLVIGPRDAISGDVPAGQQLLAGARWAGTANPLSPTHECWQAIDEAGAATARLSGSGGVAGFSAPASRPPLAPRAGEPFARLARRRRSAVAFDGVTAMPMETFLAILDALLPREGVPPWDVLPCEPLVHPVLMVHRVQDLAPGIYALARSEAGEALLRESLDASFGWSDVRTGLAHVPLRLLSERDVRHVARSVSCGQEIAADGAFSLGMVAPLGAIVKRRGAHWYRRLFWESGVLGQVLYLEAEAWGFRGTGIGCYFDDAFHRLLGVRDSRVQSLYHFTVGAPLEDSRLRTQPPYAHLARR